MTIEVDQHKYRGTCNNNLHRMSGESYCNATRKEGTPLKVCSNCLLWTVTDAIYEDLNKVVIEQTYEWWREEFIRTGNLYARDRMTDLYETPTTIVVARVRAPTVTITQVPVKKKPQQLSAIESVQVLLVFLCVILAFMWLVVH